MGSQKGNPCPLTVRSGERPRSHPWELVKLDLASQASVRRAAEQVLVRHHAVDILLNNAGLMAMPEQQTADGYGMQFGVNHLGHWSLTALLMPALSAAPAARVVTVTSTAHHVGRPVDPDPENPHLRGRYDPWRLRTIQARQLPLRARPAARLPAGRGQGTEPPRASGP